MTEKNSATPPEIHSAHHPDEAPATHRSGGSRWSKWIGMLVPPVITVGLCYVLFRGQDFGAIIAFIKEGCDFRWIALAMVLTVAGFVWRALRWRIQLRASGIDLPVMPSVYSIVGTYAVNLVFPRLGEIWRAEYVARRQRAPFSTALGAMFAERFTDVLIVIIMLVATLFLARPAVAGFIAKYPDAYRAIGGFLSSPWLYVVIVAIVGGIIVFVRWSSESSLVRKTQQMLRNIGHGFVSIFHMRGSGWWLLLTVVLWLTYFVTLVCCFEAFEFTRQVLAEHGYSAVFVCYVLASIAMGIPSNGGMGPYQIAMMFGLGCYITDLNTTDALAFGNVVLASSLIMIIACGIPTFIAVFFENRHRK